MSRPAGSKNTRPSRSWTVAKEKLQQGEMLFLPETLIGAHAIYPALTQYPKLSPAKRFRQRTGEFEGVKGSFAWIEDRA